MVLVYPSLLIMSFCNAAQLLPLDSGKKRLVWRTAGQTVEFDD